MDIPASGPLTSYTEVWPWVAGSCVLALATKGALYLELRGKVSHYLNRSSQLCLGGSKADAGGGGGRADNQRRMLMEDAVPAPPDTLLPSDLCEATFLGNQRCSREESGSSWFTRHCVRTFPEETESHLRWRPPSPLLQRLA